MIRELLSNNPALEYTIKKLRRKLFLKKMNKLSIQELMDYNATLYANRNGAPLDWNNLQTYQEKMQWAKMFDYDERKIICTDKYRVREWIKQKLGEEYLIPLLGVWDKSDDIDFNKLPNQFVLKTNCCSNDVIIVKDKSNLTKKDIKGYCKRMDYYLDMKYGFNSCELHYNKIKPLIVAEAFLEYPGGDLPDYRFFCFDGKPYFCWADTGRYRGEQEHRQHVYDMEWNLQDWHYSEFISKEGVDKPANFEKMVEIVSTLCEGFHHVRVDLYNIEGKIYFGEMTFTCRSGLGKLEPKSADLMLGELWKVDTSVR